MLWIGLTGGIASGKSTVTNLLREAGYPVVDADALAKEAVMAGSPVFGQVVQHFGPGVVLPSGELDRPALGRVIFNDQTKRLLLESLIHPYVQAKVGEFKKAHENKSAFAFYDVPLLFEKNLEKQFDFVVVVEADKETQKSRMREHRKMAEPEIESRLLSQIPMSEKVKKASFVVDNSKDLAELKKNVMQMIKFFEQK